MLRPARLITGAKRREHITPILRQLHWLPVRRRVEFKVASLVYQVLSSKVPGSGRRYSSRLKKFCPLPQVLFGEKVLCHSCSQSFGGCCSWTTYLEQLTCQSARQGSQLHRIQKTTENIHVSDGLRRIVTFLIIAPYKYSYLLTDFVPAIWRAKSCHFRGTKSAKNAAR